MKEKSLLKLMFELGVHARTRRTGPLHVGVTDHETIASHCFRHAALSYFMAKEENADTSKVLLMSLVHDFPDSRLLEQTFMQGKYYSVQDKKTQALSDQVKDLKGSDELKQAFKEYLKGESKESQIAKDANILEALIEAKEYVQQGVKIMERWFLEKKQELKTETAKKLFDILEKEDIYWWREE